MDQTVMPALHGGDLRQDSLAASGLAHWPAAMPARPGLFRTFLMGGFESSSHRRAGDERQLDLLAATRHDEHAFDDYSLLAACGIRTVRDALRWHRIESDPGRYDWSSFLPMLRAARKAGMQVIWDLCHYGVPKDLDIWSTEFLIRFAEFCAAAASVVRSESDADQIPFYCPVNEISYRAWAGGDHALMYPYAVGRGPELKRQLARAAIVAVEAGRARKAGAADASRSNSA